MVSVKINNGGTLTLVDSDILVPNKYLHIATHIAAFLIAI